MCRVPVVNRLSDRNKSEHVTSTNAIHASEPSMPDRGHTCNKSDNNRDHDRRAATPVTCSPSRDDRDDNSAQQPDDDSDDDWMIHGVRSGLTTKAQRPGAGEATMVTATLPPGNSGLVCARRLGLVIHQTFTSGKSFSGFPKPVESLQRMVRPLCAHGEEIPLGNNAASASMTFRSQAKSGRCAVLR